MSNKPLAMTPTRSTDKFTKPTAPDYAVSDAEDAWQRLNRLVDRVLEGQNKNLPNEPHRMNADQAKTEAGGSSELNGAKT